MACSKTSSDPGLLELSSLLSSCLFSEAHMFLVWCELSASLPVEEVDIPDLLTSALSPWDPIYCRYVQLKIVITVIHGRVKHITV